jgi:hypothetical protein
VIFIAEFIHTTGASVSLLKTGPLNSFNHVVLELNEPPGKNSIGSKDSIVSVP